MWQCAHTCAKKNDFSYRPKILPKLIDLFASHRKSYCIRLVLFKYSHMPVVVRFLPSRLLVFWLKIDWTKINYNRSGDCTCKIRNFYSWRVVSAWVYTKNFLLYAIFAGILRMSVRLNSTNCIRIELMNSLPPMTLEILNVSHTNIHNCTSDYTAPATVLHPYSFLAKLANLRDKTERQSTFRMRMRHNHNSEPDDTPASIESTTHAPTFSVWCDDTCSHVNTRLKRCCWFWFEKNIST